MKRKGILLLLCSLVLSAAPAQAQKMRIGTYTFKDGAIYTGEMMAGRPHGEGKTMFKSGDVYEGHYVKGKRQGKGTYTFTDGEKYEGEWLQDQQHGRGV